VTTRAAVATTVALMASATPAIDPIETLRSKRFIVVLVLAAIVGVVVSVAAWGFLELVHHLKGWVYSDLPSGLGFSATPEWWALPVLAVAGLAVGFAIVRLPGQGGHIPAHGLNAGSPRPGDLPGILLAAIASVGLGAVVGPEAPLIALGGGLGILLVGLIRRDAPPTLATVLGAAGTFAGISFLFGSPLIAAVILIEAAGLGGAMLPVILVPGLVAAGIGSLVSTGMGSWTGLSTSNIALGALPLPTFARPDLVDFLWTIPLAVAVALVTFVIFRLGNRTERVVRRRPYPVLVLAGLVVAGLAIAFSEATDKGVNEVLFSGQDALPGLIAHAGSWSLSALALLIVFKGLAYGVSLGAFRGGPTFPALYLGAAGGLMAGQLPGFEVTPAVAVALGAGVASVLRLPLSAVVLAVVLTSNSGLGSGPLIILGVAAAYLTTLAISPPPDAPTEEHAKPVASG
jgi:chloride channel protein, CIC family